jgi:hypothetical protein
MSAWNDFVKKVYHEGHNKDKNYSFKQALKDASSRKSEMGKPDVAMGVKVSKSKKSKTSRKSRKQRKSKKSKTQKRK